MLRLFVLVLALTFVGCSASSPTPDESLPVDASKQTTRTVTPSALEVHGFYSVDSYDASRDPAADLAATAKLAQADNKRILLEIGGDW